MNLVNELAESLQPLGALAGLSLEPLRTWFAEHGSGRIIDSHRDGRPVVSLAQARKLVGELAARESLLLLSPPGVGKTQLVMAAARCAGLRCYSLLGTQLAPEDLTGVPRIEGQRTVFYPPRVVLPEDGKPFCLFLDELPAAAPDVQKAMYSLLLERRIGEHALPAGSWVVAAGNRVEDGALVRAMSSALVNRLFIVNVAPTVEEWIGWAERNDVREDVRAFILCNHDALIRASRDDDAPFSTPRAWASLSNALDCIEDAGMLTEDMRRALAHGRVSPEDADQYCDFVASAQPVRGGEYYLENPDRLPYSGAARWSALAAIRTAVGNGTRDPGSTRGPRLLGALDAEERAFVLSGLVRDWLALVGPAALRDLLVTWLAEVGTVYMAEAS